MNEAHHDAQTAIAAETAIDTLVQIAQSGQFEAERIRAACAILDRLDVIERVNFAASEEAQ